MSMKDADFDDVEALLDADIGAFESYDELNELYEEMETYVKTADVMESQGRNDDADYVRELAVETYEALILAMGLDKGDDSFQLGEDHDYE